MNTQIRPSPLRVLPDWEELWRYRDLLFVLVWREVRTKYTATALGPFWLIFQSLVTSGIFFIVFSKVLNVPSAGIQPILFFFSGLLIWSYVSNCVQSISMMLVSNSGLFKKIYFPRLLLPLAHCLAGLIGVCIQLLTFGLLYSGMGAMGNVGGEGLTPYLVFLPGVFLQVALLSFGIGLWVAALTVRYRDFHHLMGLALNLWLYLTPISYPLSLVGETGKRWMSLNPLVLPIETLRLGFFGVGELNASMVINSCLITVILAGTGWIYFRKVEASFVDSL